MKRFRILIAASWILLSGCATPGSESSLEPTQHVGAASSERQILVMLTELPVRHFQPGAAGGGDYRSIKPRSMREIEKLGVEFGFRPVENWLMPSLGIRCYLAEVPAGTNPEAVVGRLAADPRVESAELVRIFHPLGHNDPYYPLQANAKLFQLDQLHAIATGKNVVVALIDTGVDLAHPDLEGQIAEAQNFVGGNQPGAEIHGTAVAGIIAAKADNRIGIVGIAPAARLLALRACWQTDVRSEGAECTSFTLAQALQFALIRRVGVINLSLAGPRDRLLERLIDKAIDQGITVVGAVDPSSSAATFPAAHPRVIAVTSAVTSSGAATAIGNAIAAPGERLLTTVPHGKWGFVSGTSFAAAEISGIAALLLEISPELSPVDLAALIARYSPQPATGGGALVLDACAMLASVAKRHECACCNRIALPQPQNGAHGSTLPT